VALQLPVPWLRLTGNEISAPVPLIPTQPVFAVGEDGSLTWSSADRLWLRRLNRSGGTEWTLSSDMTGPVITPEALATRRSALEAEGASPVILDSMAAKTPTTHPAVTLLLLNRDGRVLVGQANVPGADSVAYLVIAKDGAPLSRFKLDARAHPLLFSGDSLLLHRPTRTEAWEVLWVLFARTR
jgi:hypothetical protein